MIKIVKNILLVLFLANFAAVQASDYQMCTTTQTTFRSTSSNMGTNYSNSAYANRNVIAFANAPATRFKSTSTIYDSGSSLPCAAETGVYTTVGDEAPRSGSGPRRVGGWDDNNAGDPGAVPLGDAVLPLLLLAAAYGIYLRRKNSVQTPASGHQQ